MRIRLRIYRDACDFLIDRQGFTGSLSPIELTGTSLTFNAELFAKCRIVYQFLNSTGNRVNIERINCQRGISDDFGQAGPVADNYRSATLHRLERWQPESFKVRRVNEA